MHTAEQLRVGAAQINCQLGECGANVAKHLDFIEQGRSLGLDLLVFPELSLTGMGLGRRVLEVAMGREDERLLRLAAAAGAMQVVVGFVEEASPGEYYNALAVLQAGETMAVHRKVNLATYGRLDEGKYFCYGRDITVNAIAGNWTGAYLICADLWNPALVHAVLLSRPNLLIAPANSASGAVSDEFSNEQNWLVNIRFYAMVYGTPVIMANRYGYEGTDRFFWGGSRILGPRGEELAAAGDGEGIISATLGRTAIARARFDLPTHRDANSPLIQSLLNRHR